MDREKHFEAIINQYKGVIYKACYIITDNREDVNDCFQEILINIWNYMLKFQGKSSLSTWIYRVSINTCITFLRKNRRGHNSVKISENIILFDESDGINKQIYELYSVIGKLGQLERTLIWLWLEEKSYDEIAEITGLSKTNVGVKLMRIKDKIKTMYNE
jgi:RNA polymerase sigma-70 factor, ECF subfamily